MTAHFERAVSECGECGYEIEWTPQRGSWIHVESELPDCYRDPQHTEQAYPKYAPAPRPLEAEPAGPTLTIELLPAILGFFAQCKICPQKALLRDQPDESWICPRCAEVADGNRSKPVVYVDQIESVSMTARTWLPGDPTILPPVPGVCYPEGAVELQPIEPDDDYPISKVQG